MPILRYILNIATIFVAMISLPGCDSTSSPDDPSASHSQRTLLVYMVANNNLSGFAVRDLEEMSLGMRNASGRLLVYYAPPSAQPSLLEILPDGSRNTLMTFSDGMSSVDEGRMSTVINKMKEVAPAPGYGLVLWSHGTGWIYDQGTIADKQSANVAPMSFGWDGYPAKKMSIESLSRAIADVQWDFIYFDCCHMATVEVAYELRKRTPYIIASATELGLEGMPYDKNLPLLLSSHADLEGAMNNTFNFYNDNNTDGCCISLIHTSDLDNLAAATRDIYTTYGAPATSYIAVPYFRDIVMSTGIYDMHHHIKALCSDVDRFAAWEQTFKSVVVKHLTTPRVYGLQADDFNGLGSNVIYRTDEANVYHYTSTAWWPDVMSHAFNSHPINPTSTPQ